MSQHAHHWPMKRRRVDVTVHRAEAGSEPPRASFFGGDSYLVFVPCGVVEDLQNRDRSFRASFLHQFFANEEVPQGWSECRVRVYYIEDTLEAFVEVEGRVWALANAEGDDEGNRSDEVIVASAVAAVRAALSFPGGLIETMEAFMDRLSQEQRCLCCASNEPQFRVTHVPNYEPPGEFVASCGENADLYELKFPQSASDSSQPAAAATEREVAERLLHRRAEWLVHFFIETCSAVSLDDRWRFFFVWRKVADGLRRLCAFVSLYAFHALPKIRWRVSQFVVLPHSEKQSIGTRILKHIYREALRDPAVMELSVEDPSPIFALLRTRCSIELALENGLIGESDLYPQEAAAETQNVRCSTSVESAVYDEKDQALLEKWSSVLAENLKETSSHSKRVAEALLMARKLPAILDSDWVAEIGVSEEQGPLHRDNESAANFQMSKDARAFCMSEQLRSYRLAKKRLFLTEHLEEEDDDVEANQDFIRELLQDQWVAYFCRTAKLISSLRRRMGPSGD
eukprot:Polyplicarium_translucidae@DN908_c0_g1_i1.p1